MNKEKIVVILQACNVIRGLIEAKIRIDGVANISLRNYKRERTHLEKAVKELEYRIQRYRARVKNEISSLEGFDKSLHLEIDYISKNDIENGFIDMSLTEPDHYYLNILTGEFVTGTEVPEDKRSR